MKVTNEVFSKITRYHSYLPLSLGHTLPVELFKKKKRIKKSTLILLQSNVKNNFSVTIENQNVTHITDTCQYKQNQNALSTILHLLLPTTQQERSFIGKTSRRKEHKRYKICALQNTELHTKKAPQKIFQQLSTKRSKSTFTEL